MQGTAPLTAPGPASGPSTPISGSARQEAQDLLLQAVPTTAQTGVRAGDLLKLLRVDRGGCSPEDLAALEWGKQLDEAEVPATQVLSPQVASPVRGLVSPPEVQGQTTCPNEAQIDPGTNRSPARITPAAMRQNETPQRSVQSPTRDTRSSKSGSQSASDSGSDSEAEEFARRLQAEPWEKASVEKVLISPTGGDVFFTVKWKDGYTRKLTAESVSGRKECAYKLLLALVAKSTPVRAV
eukprot:scaffold88927_cov46-Prasinocladus_malaysianus.AAC.3